MPLNDFQCSTCGAFEIDVYQPLRDALPPMCPEGCTNKPESIAFKGVEIVPEHWPAGPASTMERLWSAGSASSPFKEISVEIQGKTVVAKSMADIREIERKTCDAWQRGVPGVAPLIFRNFSQDRSNRDVSLIDQHFGHLLKRQRGGAPSSGNPNDRRELFTKSGKRKIDIRALSPREREHVMREEGFGED